MKKGQNLKRLFFMIKPDGMSLEAKIRKMIEPLVNIVACRRFDPIGIEKIERLYEIHKNEFFYPYLMDYFKGKSIKTYLLGEREGEKYQNGFYDDFVALAGDTDPAKAGPGTIRGLSKDSLKTSLSEKRALRNLVHRSTTLEETEKEAAIFFWDYILDRSKVAGEQGELGKFLAGEGEGIFYEERLENSLRKRKLLSSEEELKSYQDLGCQEGNSFKVGRAMVKSLKNGSVSEGEITVRFNFKTSP